MKCPRCNFANSDDNRFCGQCGTLLKADQSGAVRIPTESERRVVTILFADVSGGLRDVSAERDFVTGFRVRESHDEFEVDRRDTSDRDAMQPFQVSSSTRRESCFHCHAVSNFYGTRSFQRSWISDEKLNEKSPPMCPVGVMELQAVEKTAVKWKESQSGWAALRKLLPE